MNQASQILMLLMLGALMLGCGKNADRDRDNYFGAEELRGSALYDCNDDDFAVGAGMAFYRDADNDGHGDQSRPCFACGYAIGEQIAAASQRQDLECEMGITYVHNAADCDDGDPTTTSGIFYFYDWEGDGLGDPEPAFGMYACDDLDALADFVINGDDCDNGKRYDSSDSSDTGKRATWYLDDDGDGLGGLEQLLSCRADLDPNNSYVSVTGDCDDADSGLPKPFFADLDSDGYGNPDSYLLACVPPSSDEIQYVDNKNDCEDDPAKNGKFIHPNVVDCYEPEKLDDDCDGTFEEDEGALWYFDADDDGFGDPLVTLDACKSKHAGDQKYINYRANAGDCDDSDEEVPFKNMNDANETSKCGRINAISCP